MKRQLSPCAVALSLLLFLLPQHRSTGQESAANVQNSPNAQGEGADRATLEKQLAERLNNARMTGFYSIEGQEGPPQPDQYTLGKVQKSEGDKWLFTADLQYGKKSMKVPLEIPVLWAGDTPVISVTNLAIPGMGTYTARVMIYGDAYAGTWSSPRHGGYLWGRIHPISAEATKSKSQPAKPLDK